MRPGILIQHARDARPDTGLVRGDVAAFIGVVPRSRWPAGATLGDFVDQPLSSFGELRASAARRWVDPVTARAIQAYFANGGDRCHAVTLCVESEKDLVSNGPFARTFRGLLDHLRGEEDIGLLAMPILAYLPIGIDRLGRPEVPADSTRSLLLEHCREMNHRFLVLDTPHDLHDEPLHRWADHLRERNRDSASYGALYYPWLMSGEERFPPSGSVAGLYARVELENQPFGVRWPPANQVLRGVSHPAVAVRWRESDRLTASHVNPILTQPSRGVVVWGARTLSKDPRWVHINTRRIASMIAEQLRRDSEWVVFEHQRPELWEIITRTLTARLDQLWTAGLLAGDVKRSEYEVTCNPANNPQGVRERAQVNVEVRIRPISTAESIVVELRLGT